MELFNSLKSRLETYDEPFKHWAINKPLTELAIKEVCNAEIANPINDGLNYDGTRAIDGGEGKYREGIKTGGKAKKYRCFITKENSKNFPNLSNFVEELCSKNVHQYIGDLINNSVDINSTTLSIPTSILFLGISFVCASIFIANQIYDLEVDEINNKAKIIE